MPPPLWHSVCPRRSIAPMRLTRSWRPKQARPSPQPIAEGISADVDLIFWPRALPRGDQRVHARSGRGLENAVTRLRSTRGLVLRVPRGYRDRQATDAVGTDEAKALKGRLERSTYALRVPDLRRAVLHRAAPLATAGANPQRPLWASTGVKDPNLPTPCT